MMRLGAVYLILNIFFTVSSQILLKRELAKLELENSFKINFIFQIFKEFFSNAWLFISISFYFLASLTWILALTKFNLSFAYPFSIISYLLVFLFATFYLNETSNFYNLIGVVFIIIGLLLISKK